MIDNIQTISKYAGIAAMALFVLLLIWYLIRYFSEAQQRPIPFMCRHDSRPRAPETSIWKVLVWVLIAFVVSRALIYTGSLISAYRNGILDAYLAHTETFWSRWDANHYVGLIENWYVNEGDPRFHIVFFPLYPAIARGLYLITGLSPTVCAYLVSNIAFIGCGIFIYRLAEITYGCKYGLRALWLMFLSPLTLFCSIPYTESVFMLATIAAVYFARRRHFALAVICGALSANARMVGMATAIPIFYEMLRTANGAWYKRYGLSILKVLPVAAGLLAYIWLNYNVTGDPFRFLQYQSEHWSQNFGSLYNTLNYTINYAFTFHVESYREGVFGPQTIAIILMLILFIVALRRSHPGEMGYSLVYFYCSVAPTWLLSGPRYITAMYSAYPLIARLFPSRIAFVLICILLGALCMLAGSMYGIDGSIL